MPSAWFGCCQAFCRLTAVRALPEEPAVAFPIRLEDDVLTVRRPDGIDVPALQRQAACNGVLQVINHPDSRVRSVVGRDDQTLSIG